MGFCCDYGSKSDGVIYSYNITQQTAIYYSEACIITTGNMYVIGPKS